MYPSVFLLNWPFRDERLQVFIGIAVILGDGLYNFLKIMIKSGYRLYIFYHTQNQLPVFREEGKHPTFENFTQH